MKMIMISYNSAINSDVMELLDKCGIKNFTKWTQVQGKGRVSGPHFGDEIWPGENSVIFTAVEDDKVEGLLPRIREVRSKLGKAGVKAFVWNLKEVT